MVTYNGENRPISWYCGTPNIVKKFDRMGRRVELIETITDPVESAVTTNKHQRFVYDGYLCIQRLNGANNAVTDLFEWDPTERVATRPLFWQPRTAEGNFSLFYTHDGNKNVSEVVFYQRARGVAVHYEYAPFGEVTVQTRGNAWGSLDLSALNPWRFSSEYADDALGLVYYNYRHYEPTAGRWLQRDPVEEVGGVNAYLSFFNALYNDNKGLKAECENCNKILGRIWSGKQQKEFRDQNKGCRAPKVTCVSCGSENWSGRTEGGSRDGMYSEIKLCYTSGNKTEEDYAITLKHELQHASDACRLGKRDFNCEESVCSEISAYNRASCAHLSGALREECVKNGAKASLVGKKACQGKSESDINKIIDDKYQSCL